jgi:TRAP-type C4-dicarboxylate transport system permease small subunit
MVKEDAGATRASNSSNSVVHKTARSFETGLTSVCRVMNILGVVVLLAMTAMTVFDVIGRVFKRPIIGSTEITEFMMVTIVFLCLAWVAVKGRMITVDLITMRLSSRVNAILNSITLFIGTGVIGVVSWQSYLATFDSYNDMVETIILHIPSYPFMWVLSIGFSVLTIVMAMLFVKNLAKAVNR